jgi:hypothetical protein
MAVCTATDLPVVWNVRAAREDESIHALPLIDKARERGFAVEKPASVWIEASGLRPLIARETPRGTAVYRRRAAVEREFGRLKNQWSLTPLPVRGVGRVRLHAELTILAKLASVLARERLAYLAA